MRKKVFVIKGKLEDISQEINNIKKTHSLKAINQYTMNI